MASNYEKIRGTNIEDYGKKTNHISYLGRLYPDRTHFIFEILQNAEDAGAEKVLFDLYKDKIIVKHDAERVFDDNDVKGICGVGEGTKDEDLNKIGTFGIGFKSVYAYTKSPEIHSGEEHFRIEHFVRPFKTEPIVPKSPWTTLFVLKFNNEEISQADAYNEIAKRLKNLKAKTLLFLRSINEVEYKIEDDQNGVYLKEQKVKNNISREVTVIGQNNGIEEDERWLVFEKSIDISDAEEKVYLEIGFKLTVDKEANTQKIQTIKQSPLVVYFPTEKETNLGFLIQGPYKTTPARDNIPKDNQWNACLIKKTTAFLIEILHELKKMNLLTVDLLKTLPIDSYSFPEDSMFYPIYSEVKNALLNEDLLPTDDGNYVSGKNAKIARGSELRKLLTKTHLEQLYNQKDVNWLDGNITSDRTPILRIFLKNNLSIEEIDNNAFAGKINDEFLSEQSDQWMIHFYEYFRERKESWKKPTRYNRQRPLRYKPIIRLQDDSHVKPFRINDGEPNAYLPTTDATESRMPTVKSELIKSESAFEFLKELEIPELDEVEEVIKNILPKYSSRPEEIGDEEHKDDIQAIIQAYKTDSRNKKNRLENMLYLRSFIKADFKSKSNKIYHSAKELHDRSDEMNLYFSNNNSYNKIAYFYSEEAIEVFKEIGLKSEIPVICNSKYESDRHIDLKKNDGNYRRGLNGFDADIKVIGLENALKNPSLELSGIIWNKIVIRYYHCIEGRIVISSRQTFSPKASTYKEVEVVSDFGKILKDNSWLPGPDGKFYQPKELKLSDLPDNFKRDRKLIKLLGMKSDTSEILAKEVGIETDAIDFIKNYPAEFSKWKESVEKKNKPEFPKRESSNPSIRKSKMTEQIKSAPNKEYQKREQSVRVSNKSIDPKTALRNFYTNPDGQLICQICKNEMPFKGRDNQYYFESVEVFSKDSSSKEHNAQHLALCPLCAAKYKEFIKRDEDSLEKLRDSILISDELEVSLTLGEERASIRFVETHMSDLKSILEYSD